MNTLDDIGGALALLLYFAAFALLDVSALDALLVEVLR